MDGTAGQTLSLPVFSRLALITWRGGRSAFLKLVVARFLPQGLDSLFKGLRLPFIFPDFQCVSWARCLLRTWNVIWFGDPQPSAVSKPQLSNFAWCAF